MKKIIVLFLIVLPWVLQSCEKDAQSGFGGTYYFELENHRIGEYRRVVQIKKNNVLVYYHEVSQRKVWDEYSVPFPEQSGWYYENGRTELMTYYIESNQIFFSNGWSYAIDLESGQMHGWTKW